MHTCVCVCSSSLTDWLWLQSGFVASCVEISFFLFHSDLVAAECCTTVHALTQQIYWLAFDAAKATATLKTFLQAREWVAGQKWVLSVLWIMSICNNYSYFWSIFGTNLSILCVCGIRGMKLCSSGPRGDAPAPCGRHCPSPFISVLLLPVWLHCWTQA